MRPDSVTVEEHVGGIAVKHKRERIPSTIDVECINKTGDLVDVSVCPNTPFWIEELLASGKLMVGYTRGGHPSQRLTPEKRLALLKEYGITFTPGRVNGRIQDLIVVRPGSEVDKRRKEMAESLVASARLKPMSKATTMMAQMQADAAAQAQAMMKAAIAEARNDETSNKKTK